MNHNHMRYILLAFMIPISYQLTYADSSLVAPQIVTRSQGVNLPRRIVGIIDDINRPGFPPFYGTLDIALAYTRSFDSSTIRRQLFGCDVQSCDHIVVSGSSVPNRGAHDWLADYFYLPSDFQSILSFTPVIDNFIIDPMIYFGLDEWIKGLYFTLYFPIVHSRWDLQFSERVINPGVADYGPGYLTADATGLPRQDLLENFTHYAHGATISPTNNVNSTLFDGLDKALIRSKKNIATRVADIRATAGLNVINNEKGRLGFYVEGAGPTGDKPEGDYLFEAIVGNNFHWELGGGMSGQYTLWRSTNEEQEAIFFVQGAVTHLFGRQHIRSFDLVDKPLSRYMLAQAVTDSATNLLAGTQTPSSQFDNQYAPLANLITMPVDVHVSAQVDALCMIHYAYQCWSCDIGYDFWARSCERIHAIPERSPLAQESWALKGDAQLFGFTTGTNAPVELSATQEAATIHSGTNVATGISAATNPNIDSPAPAFTTIPTVLTGTPSGSNQINTSIAPVVLSLSDVALVGTRGMSSSVFAHVSRQWEPTKHGWLPFIGIGGYAEFAHTPRATAACNCDIPCVATAVSNWSIWCKGGASF